MTIRYPPLPARLVWALYALLLAAPSAAAGPAELQGVGRFLQGEIAATAAGTRDVRKLAAPTDLYAQLGFERSPDVTADAQLRFVEELGMEGAEGGTALLDSLSTGAALASFDEQLAAAGYSGSNLLDVMAAYLLQSWQLAHGGRAAEIPSGLAPVRYQLMRAFATEPGLLELPDAEQQLLAEQLVYSVTLATLVGRTLVARGDAALLARFQAGVVAGVLRVTGLDLKEVQPSPEGFVARDQ